jgi:L-seryl-tRNA(Ser) seleniumtransferase
LALSTLADDREVLVARAEVGDIGPAEPLPNLIAAAHARLREVGTTNRALAADYEAAVSPNTAVVLAISPDEYRVVGQTASADLEELVVLARERELVLIAALGSAPLVEPPASMNWPSRSVRAALSAGIDLVAICGDGFLGGPPSGLLLGNRNLITRVSQHPLCLTCRLDTFRSAALAAALEFHRESVRGMESLPAWQLLTTPVENLRNRAERIAPQLAQAADIATAAAVETRSPVSAALAPDGGLLSYGVALTTRTNSIAELDNRLRTLPLPIIGRIENNRLILDLRTVLPRQDRALVEVIVGTPVKDQPAADEST